jgi:hypothetical protein
MLPSSRSSYWPQSIWLPHQNTISISYSLMRALWPVHLILFDFIILVIFGEE